MDVSGSRGCKKTFFTETENKLDPDSEETVFADGTTVIGIWDGSYCSALSSLLQSTLAFCSSRLA